jgi:hypothetical protein
MKASGMSTIAISHPSSASMMAVSRMASVATVGDLASSLEMNHLCRFPPDTVIALMVPSRFSL